jgi:hypothetical protein
VEYVRGVSNVSFYKNVSQSIGYSFGYYPKINWTLDVGFGAGEWILNHVCENCILQRIETIYHLFLKCSFARNCWNSIGVLTPNIACPQMAAQRIKRQLHTPCVMEIIILVAWSIWKCKNGWIFQNIPPTIERCQNFLQELKWLQHRVKPDLSQNLSVWLDSDHL